MPLHDQQVQFHVEISDITPREPVVLGGFANRKGLSDGIHRPLKVRCLGLRQNKTRVCLIALDLLEMERSLIDTLREEVARRTGIDQKAVLIHSIHTHSGPWMERGVSKANDRYIQFALETIASTAVRAVGEDSQWKNGRIRVGRTICTISANRELVVPESGMAFRQMNPQGLNDQEVCILQLFTGGEEVGVTLVNYACHPVVLGYASNIVSPDYPGRAREIIEDHYGGCAIFFNGAAGDINPVEEGKTDPIDADQYGESLGRAVIEAELHEDDGPVELFQKSKTIQITYRDQEMTREFIESEITRKSQQVTEFLTWKKDLRVWGDRMIQRLESFGIGEGLAVEIAALRLGSTLLFFSQGEVFIRYQIELKKKAAPHLMFVVGYTNGEIGYIPSADAFRRGGYETDMAYIYTFQPSPLTSETENLFFQNANSLLKEVECNT